MIKHKECPRCHSTKTGSISEVEDNIQYGLVRVDRNHTTPKINVEKVISVDVYGCGNCGYIFFENTDLIGQDPDAE